MYWISRLMIAAAAAALVFAAAPSQAQICVSPTKSNCESTIQAGIDAASAGETVQIQNGTYFENVLIPPGQDGLVLRGGKGAVLDPDDRYEFCSVTTTQACTVDSDCPAVETCPNVGTGNGIEVQSNSVEIRGFTIRNGDSHAIFLDTNVTGTMINGMAISGSGDSCIELDSGNDNTAIERNSFFGCGDDGVSGLGDNLLIARNSFLFMDNDAIEVDGNNIIAERNNCQNVEDGTCVDIDGDSAEIANNRCQNCDDYVAQCDGNDCLVERNRGNGSGAGADVSGDNPVVINNRFDDNGDNDDIIDVSCNVANCSTCLIANNRISGTNGDTDGIDLNAAFDGCLVDKNRIDRVLDTGIDTSGAGAVTVSNNRVTTAGGDSGEPCYDIGSDNSLVERNQARECFGHGFELDADNTTLDSNRAQDVLEDGFNVDGTGNTISDNSAQDTNGAGFAITSGATGTSVDGNRTPGNKTRVDACDEGAGTTVGAGNDFDTVAPVCPDLL